MNATYMSADSFTVGGDYTSEFVGGRRVRCFCGVDGYKYRTIKSSNYTTLTTVILDEDIDQALTSNLSSVVYGVIKPGSYGSIPDHNHSDSFGQGGNLLKKHFLL